MKPDNNLTMRLLLPDSKYAKPDSQISFHERLKERLEAIPGVETAAIADFLPTGGSSTLPYELTGAPPPDERRRPTLSALVISPDLFPGCGRSLNFGPGFHRCGRRLRPARDQRQSALCL